MVRASARIIGTIAVGLLVLNAGLQMVDILLRWLFSAPQIWIADFYSLTLPIAIAACFPLTLVARGMINIQALGQKLGGIPHKVLRIGADVALLVFFLIMTWQMYRYAGTMFSGRRTSFYLGIPLAPTWFSVVICLAFASLVQVFIVTKSLVKDPDTADDGSATDPL